MCGILGGINTDFDGQTPDRLRHRGPDQARLVTEEVPGHGTITLGQTRLNIVDRCDIDLPVRVGDNTILFNGEIYNHPELRTELKQLGWTFQTKTDTEVALVSYLQWGPECLDRFNGMFALAIWDGRRFFCARDRMGKKPLFYRCGAGRFEFASEIKAFSNLEFVSQDVFDLFEFCFNEHTLYRDIFSLGPGSFLVYDLAGGTCHTQSYWDIKQQVEHKISDERQAVDTFIGLMEDAVGVRLRADVPVSLFLSGGLDSAIIASLSGVEEAFTCQFTEFARTINEEEYARNLADSLGITLNFVRPTRDEFLKDLAAMAYHLEMPTGSFSVFPLYRLAKACHRGGYKVVLSGEGSDELFAGYVRNEFLLSDQHTSNDPKRRNYASMLRRYNGSDLDRFCRMASRSGLAGASLMKMFLAEQWSDRKSMLENICYVESRIFLQPLLQMADRMCMAHSVEARCPYLDHRIVEFAFSLDDSLRYRDGTGKWIVHQAARKLLPRGSLVLQRPVKHGLPTPVNLWMQGRHSFDRRYWNTLMTAECIKSLLTSSEPVATQDHVPVPQLVFQGPAHTLEPTLPLGRRML
ncbi:MAG: asparagine synthase (glutamine-hydrolyzing) [Phycisphaerales bacterium]|nr:MAG: asparagine synthase (glutamine-hydrolyzing) [Phycisphaerales bacterium]